MLKKIFLVAIILLLSVSNSFAFLYQLKVLSKSEISRLSDDKLLDAYIDALVEVEASATFHQTSGFKPSDYEKYKKLIRYRILLKQEINKRDIQEPDVTSAPSLKRKK